MPVSPAGSEKSYKAYKNNTTAHDRLSLLSCCQKYAIINLCNIQERAQTVLQRFLLFRRCVSQIYAASASSSSALSAIFCRLFFPRVTWFVGQLSWPTFLGQQYWPTLQGVAEKSGPLNFFAIFSATVWDFNMKFYSFIYRNLLHLTAK